MKVFFNAFKIIAVISVCSILLISCKKSSNEISYGDVVYDVLSSSKYLDLKNENETHVEIVKKYEDAELLLVDMGISESALSLYNDEYFKSNDLIVVLFNTNPNYTHKLERMILDGDILTIYISEKIPTFVYPIGRGKSVLIEIQKDAVPDNIRFEVKITT